MKEQKKYPSESEIQEMIGVGYSKYQTFMKESEKKQWKFVTDWKNSKQSGWFQTGDINRKRIFYFFPKDNGFIFRMVFNDKAIDEIKKGSYPDFIVQTLEKTKKYHEGKPFDLNENSFEIELVKDLIEVKLNSMK